MAGIVARGSRLFVNHAPRLSMLRSYTPADLLTLANASCGTVTDLRVPELYRRRSDTLAVDGVRAAAASRWSFDVARRLRRAARSSDGNRGSAPTSTRSPTSSRSASRRPCSATRSGCAACGTRSCLTVLRLLRHQPSRPVQRHRGGADQRRHRQGALLRGHCRFRPASCWCW